MNNPVTRNQIHNAIKDLEEIQSGELTSYQIAYNLRCAINHLYSAIEALAE